MSEPVLIAAGQTAHALSGLMLHATENSGFGDMPVVEMLAEALALAIDVHIEINVEDCDETYREALLELRNAAATFIEGWAG